MINIKIVCVGKINDKNLKGLSDEYLKRLGKYAKLEVIEIEEENIGVLDETKVINLESKKILDKIEKINKNGKAKVICLDLKGKMLSSTELSEKISSILTYEASTIVFIIGGSLGFNDEVRNVCDFSLSFSKLTFPHQLIRIFLYEQIFRAFKILNNETYHH